MSSEIEKLTFEEAVSRLETILKSMEEGNVPLAELVTKFEEGTKLLKTSQNRLREAELKVEKLDARTGNLAPFGDQGSDD